MANEKLDEVMQSIAELTATVKGRGGDATIDMDAIRPEFEAMVKEMTDERVKAAMDARPQRRGEMVGADEGAKVKRENRYFKTVNDIAKDGKSKSFGSSVKAVDLWLAHNLMERRASEQRSRGERVTKSSGDLIAAVKALSSGGVGTGDELVPLDMSSQIWDDMFLMSRVVGSMNSIGMTSNPMDIPLSFGDMTWRKGSENTATTPTDPATANGRMTTTELVTEVNWSYTLDEDAIVAVAPLLRSRIAQSGAEIMDDFALNADATSAATGNINSDDGSPAADAYYLSSGQDGLIHQWLIDNTNMANDAGGDALTDADITGALAGMGKYAVDPNQVVMVTGANTYLNGLLTLTNVIGNDQIGFDNVILTGQLASYRGIPIVVSASHRLAEADGKLSTTAASNTLGRITFFNRQTWLSGFKRNLLIETDRDIRKRQMITVVSLRQAIASRGTRSTNTHTAGVYNILV
jgi:HK97 family phage major capsid protein